MLDPPSLEKNYGQWRRALVGVWFLAGVFEGGDAA